MTRRPTLLSTVLSCAAMVGASALVCVAAQPVTGPYISLSGGGSLLQDERLEHSPFDTANKLGFDAGPVASSALGYGFGNGFRLQVQGSWKQNRLDSISNFGSNVSTGGRQQNYGGTADAIFDLDIGQTWIYPYFGAGAGYSETRWTSIHGSGETLSGFGTDALAADGRQGHFAYEGLFGLSFPIAYVTGLSLTAEYRFSGVVGRTSFPASGEAGLVAFAGRAGGSTAYNHSGLVGLRYALFQPSSPATPAPAPAQAAAPAMEPARTYLVFFDWDRADLTTRARQIVAEAAQASTHVQTTRIEVNGYTDLSGAAAYNQGLSVRRAQSVEAELVRDGVSRGEISIHGHGQSSPLVQTAKGVREPQNRRVEIVLR